MEVAQPTPAPHRLGNMAANISLPQVRQLCPEEPREERKQCPSDATARLAMDTSTGQCCQDKGSPVQPPRPVTPQVSGTPCARQQP